MTVNHGLSKAVRSRTNFPPAGGHRPECVDCLDRIIALLALPRPMEPNRVKSLNPIGGQGSLAIIRPAARGKGPVAGDDDDLAFGPRPLREDDCAFHYPREQPAGEEHAGREKAKPRRDPPRQPNILGKRREKLSRGRPALVARNQTAQLVSFLPISALQPPRGFEPCMLFLKHHPENVGSPQW